MSQADTEHEQTTIPSQGDFYPEAVDHLRGPLPLASPAPSSIGESKADDTKYTISSDQEKFPLCNEYNSSNVDDIHSSSDNVPSNDKYSSDDGGGYNVGCNTAFNNHSNGDNRKRKLISTSNEDEQDNLKFTDSNSPHSAADSCSSDAVPSGGGGNDNADNESKVNLLPLSTNSPAAYFNQATPFEESLAVSADTAVEIITKNVEQLAPKVDAASAETSTVPSSYYFVDRAPSSQSTSNTSPQSSGGSHASSGGHHHRHQSSGHGHSGYHRSSHGDRGSSHNERSSSHGRERSSHGGDKSSNDAERSSNSGERHSSHGGDRSSHRHSSSGFSSQRSAPPARDPDEGKIFVGGLSWDTTDESLKTYFSKYGKLSDSVVMKTPEGKTRGFAFVTFEDPAVVDVIISQTHYVDGKRVDPKPAIPRDAQHKSEKMFIGGLPWGTTEDELKRYFSSYGTVLSATLMVDQESNQSRGFGFVTFQSSNDLQNALSCQPHTIKGQTVETTRALPKTKYAEGISTTSPSEGLPPPSKRSHSRSESDAPASRYSNLHVQQSMQPQSQSSNQYQQPGQYQNPGQPQHLVPQSMPSTAYSGGPVASMHPYGGVIPSSQQASGYGGHMQLQSSASVPSGSGTLPISQPQMGYAAPQYNAGNRPGGPVPQQTPTYMGYGQTPSQYPHPQYAPTPSASSQPSQLGYQGAPHLSQQGFHSFAPPILQSQGSQAGMQAPGSYYQHQHQHQHQHPSPQAQQQQRGSFYGVVSSSAGGGGPAGAGASQQQPPAYYGGAASSGVGLSSYYSAMPSTYLKQTGPPSLNNGPMQQPYSSGAPVPSAYQRGGPAAGGNINLGSSQAPPQKPSQSSYYAK